MTAAGVAFAIRLATPGACAGPRSVDAGTPRTEPLGLDAVDPVVRSWNRRKGQLFTPRHVEVALDRLRRLGWLCPSGSQGLFA